MSTLFKHTPLGGWSPLAEDGVDGGKIRLYTSDEGVNPVAPLTSATRVRAGVQCQDMGAGAGNTPVKAWSIVYSNADPPEDPLAIPPVPPPVDLVGDELLPVDGQGFFEMDDGRFLLVGGAPGGYGIDSCNTVWKSDDRGRSWQQLLAPEKDRNGEGTRSTEAYTRFARGHTLGFLTHTYDNVKYHYVIGGDPVIGANAEVWRTPSSGTGEDWELVTSTAPFDDANGDDRTLFLCWSLGGVMYVAGGQPSAAVVGDPNVYRKIYYSENGGEDWYILDDGVDPILLPVHLGMVLGQLPQIGDEVFLVGGGVNQDPNPSLPADGDNKFYNAVRAFDGETWRTVLAEGHGGTPQFAPVRYLSVVREVGSERLWKFNGALGVLDADNAIAQYSDNGGSTWETFVQAPSGTLPWGGTHAQAALATKDGVYLTQGFQSTKLFVVRSETGVLVETWEDQGEDGLTLTSTTGKEPLRVPKMFGGKPGIVAHGEQIMKTTSPDVGIATGGFEVWAIVKSLNFQDSLAECILVGNVSGSTYLNVGLVGGKLCVELRGDTVQVISTDADINDDRPHLIGMQFYPGDDEAIPPEPATVSLLVDGIAVDADIIKDGLAEMQFNPSYTGWRSVFGGGFPDVDNDVGSAVAVMGALVIRREATQAWGAATIAKLVAWSRAWGVRP